MENLSKPPRTLNEVTPELLEDLNNGLKETRNLIEWLAINPILLFNNLLKSFDRLHYKTDNIPKHLKKNALHQWISYYLYQKIQENQDDELMVVLSKHTSDVVRGWYAYIVGYQYNNDIKNLLKNIQPCADDPHFSVREIAWMACRQTLSKDLEHSIEILKNWVIHKKPTIRRFAIEVLRPRGVWCFHIQRLKEKPELALPLLTPLKSEQNRYVQNSLANWLNDASKTRPDFVIQLCEDWKKEENPHTSYIVKRALRTLHKK